MILRYNQIIGWVDGVPESDTIGLDAEATLKRFHELVAMAADGEIIYDYIIYVRNGKRRKKREFRQGTIKPKVDIEKAAAALIKHENDRVLQAYQEQAQKMETINITPEALKLADDNGVNVELVKGTGPGSLISTDDVQKFIDLNQKPQPSKKAAKKKTNLKT